LNWESYYRENGIQENLFCEKCTAKALIYLTFFPHFCFGTFSIQKSLQWKNNPEKKVQLVPRVGFHVSLQNLLKCILKEKRNHSFRFIQEKQP